MHVAVFVKFYLFTGAACGNIGTMNAFTHGAPPELSTTRTPINHARHLVALPDPTYRLLERISVLRGVPKSDAMYEALRDTLRKQEECESWAYAPPPFSIKPTHIDAWIGVLLWNPWLPTVVLSGSEACRLAEVLYEAVEGTERLNFELVSGRGNHRIVVSRGAAHVALHIDGQKYAMVRPVAKDVAAALESASVGSSPASYAGIH